MLKFEWKAFTSISLIKWQVQCFIKSWHAGEKGTPKIGAIRIWGKYLFLFPKTVDFILVYKKRLHYIQSKEAVSQSCSVKKVS